MAALLGCGGPPPAPAGGVSHAALDQVIGWLGSSKVTYHLEERSTATGGFEAFFQAGFPGAMVPVDRRALQVALERASDPAASSFEAHRALVKAVLLDRRGGEAWARYLTALADGGRSVFPAPLLPPGNVSFGPDGVSIIFPRADAAWAFYLGCKAAARLEPDFRIFLGLPVTTETRYRWTLAEETACLRVLTQAIRRARSEGLEPRGLQAWLLDVEEARLLPGYVWVEVIALLAPGRLAGATDDDRADAAAYLRFATRPVEGLPPASALPAFPSRTYLDALVDDDLLRFRAAQTAMSVGGARDAHAALEALCQRHPRNGMLWRELADARMAVGDLQGAAAAAARADAELPGQPGIWAAWARALLAAGRLEAAERIAGRLRWLWWLARDPALMRAPILVWGDIAESDAGHPRVLIERLDALAAEAAPFWVLEFDDAGEPPAPRPLKATTPGEALEETRSDRP